MEGGQFIFQIGMGTHSPVSLRIEIINGRALDEGQIIRTGGPIEAERFDLMPDLDTAKQRDALQTDVDILERYVAAGEIKFGPPVDVVAHLSDGAQSGAPEADGVRNHAKVLYIAVRLADQYSVGVDATDDPCDGL